MRFPGQRIRKHYFPVSSEAVMVDPRDEAERPGWSLVGLDQVLVDMEVRASTAFIREAGLVPGESDRLSDGELERLLSRIQRQGLPFRYAPGGSVANSLNNYSLLSGEASLLLGAIEDPIPLHGPAYQFVSQTPKGVDLSHLVPATGGMGVAVTLISEDGTVRTSRCLARRPVEFK